MLSPEEMDKFRKCEKALLKHATYKSQSSAKLLDTAERKNPKLSGSMLRWAYWNLVEEGKLTRTPRGIRLGRSTDKQY